MKRKIFVNFIKFLSDNDIDYAVLGNTQLYPDLIDGDVDIVLNPTVYKDVNSVMFSFANTYHYSIVNLFEHEIEAKYFVVTCISENESREESASLALDFCCNYYRKNRLILLASFLLKNNSITNVNGINMKIPSTNAAFVYYLVKKMEKGFFSTHQLAYLRGLWLSDKERILQTLNLMFENNFVENINRVMDSNQTERESNNLLLNHKDQLIKKFKVNWSDVLPDLIRKYRRCIKPTGLVVAFLGCDGSGKSTVIELLKQQIIQTQEFRGVSYHHLYPKSKAVKNATPVTNPHQQQTRNSFTSFLKLIYFSLRYFVGNLLIVFPEKISSRLIIFDRYYHDILVDPIRYRHKGNKWLTTFLSKMIPKPDLIFYVDAPVEVLQARKQEVSFEESSRQRKAYIQLSSQLPNVAIIENVGNPEEASSLVHRKIDLFLAKRFIKYYS